MLDHELKPEKGVLIVRPKGPLAAGDFAALAKDVDAYIEARGALNGLMICAEKFPGWEGLEAAVSHFRFVRDHHKKISRVALISDSDVLALLPRVASHFVAAEVKHFKQDEEKKAMAWIGD